MCGISSQAKAVVAVPGNIYDIQVNAGFTVSDAYLLYGSFTGAGNSTFSGGISLINNGDGLTNGTPYSVNVGSVTPSYYGLLGVYSGDVPGVTLGMSNSTATGVAEGESFSTFFPRELGYFQFPNQVTDNHVVIGTQTLAVTFNINPIDSSTFTEADMVGDLQTMATGTGTVTGISGTYSYTLDGNVVNGTFPGALAGVPVDKPVTGFTFSIATNPTITSNIQSDLIAAGGSGTLVDFTNGTGNGNFNVTATPEPSSMWLLGAAGLPLLAWRKRWLV